MRGGSAPEAAVVPARPLVTAYVLLEGGLQPLDELARSGGGLVLLAAQARDGALEAADLGAGVRDDPLRLAEGLVADLGGLTLGVAAEPLTELLGVPLHLGRPLARRAQQALGLGPRLGHGGVRDPAGVLEQPQGLLRCRSRRGGFGVHD